jgi:hypothetical protein
VHKCRLPLLERGRHDNHAGAFGELAPQAAPPKFDGFLDTPQYRVVLSDANMPEILSMEVPGVRTRVRIWTNHPTEPDDVVIALG